jgi:hypothetical protein
VRLSLAPALVALLTTVLVVELVVIAPHPATIAMVGAASWMALSGIVLARRIFAPRDPSGIAAALLGPVLGFGIGVFGLLVLWALGLQNWLAIVAGSALIWVVAAVAGRWRGPTLQLPAFDRRDVSAVAVLLFVVPLVTWAPYDHVREPVADGEAYRAYFTADFVWGMTVTSELAKGRVPPVNPFLRGAPLRYYWMSHLLSGALYRNVRAWGATAEQVVLVDGLVFGLAAVMCLYALARIAGGSPGFAALAVAVGFLANSYEGVNRLWVFYQHHTPLSTVTTLNIDAVTRWFYSGMPVDGLQRMLLYQPHHLTGYMMGLLALWLVGCAEDVTETSVALCSGILLGLSLLFSTFTAMIIGLAAATLYAARLFARRAFRALIPCAILGAGPVLVATALASMLGYTNPNHGIPITVGVNPVAVRQWPLMFLLSFGPLLFAAAAGLTRVAWVVREGAAPAALTVAALAFYFLTDVPDQQGVWVGWRSGHLLLIAWLVVGAAASTAVWQRRMWRPLLVATLILVIAPAVPTVAIDVYNAQDITNRGPGADFPWTTIISPLERQGLDWVRQMTPEDAVVQYEPYARGAAGWCYITAFAERRMAAGLPGAMIPFKPFQMASDDVRSGVFRAQSGAEAHAMAVFLGIDYLLIGAVERAHFHAALVEIARRPDLFPQVFKNDAITIYRVAR